MLLHGRGYDDEVVAAGALHDVVEKTTATVDDLAARFGSRIASLVAAVSDPPGIDDYAARKAALRDQVAHAGPEAQAIYAADKLAKTRELRALATGEHVALTAVVRMCGHSRRAPNAAHHHRLTLLEAALAPPQSSPRLSPWLCWDDWASRFRGLARVSLVPLADRGSCGSLLLTEAVA